MYQKTNEEIKQNKQRGSYEIQKINSKLISFSNFVGRSTIPKDGAQHEDEKPINQGKNLTLSPKIGINLTQSIYGQSY